MSVVNSLIGLVSSTASSAGSAPAQEKAAVELPSLRPGQMVEVRLVAGSGVQGEGLVTLEMGGRPFQAQCPTGLPVGQPIVLEVTSTGPPLVLKLPEVPDELTGLLRSLRPPSTPYPEAVSGIIRAEPGEGTASAPLRGLQGLLALPGDAAEPAELGLGLERLVTRSGLFHEAFLARGEVPEDVKGFALRLLGSSELSPGLRGAVEALLGHVEAYQARSMLEGVPVVPFFLPWGSDGLRGEWAIEERSGSDGEGRAASGCVRIQLDMPLLGAVEARVRWSPAGTSVRLSFGPSALPLAEAKLDELAGALAEAGIRVKGLRADALQPAQPRSGPGMLELRA